MIRARRKGSVWIELPLSPTRGAAFRFTCTSNCRDEFCQRRARDFVRLAQAFFLTDRLFRRSWTFGRQCRELEVEVPVVDVGAWRAIAPDVERWANFVTHDRWRIRFVRNQSDRPASEADDALLEPFTAVALFSGGLDSYCGAVELARARHNPVFVTHNPPGPAAVDRVLQPLGFKLESTQEALACVSFRLQAIPWTTAGRKSRFPERSRRSRALFFLSLAGAVAVEFGVPLITMNENGIMAINLPLIPGNTGANITRHAHPETLRLFQKVLVGIWPWEGPAPRVKNLLAGLTKQDAVERLGKARKLARNTLTCEYAGQQIAVLRKFFASVRAVPPRECGLCVPCLVRRAALKNAGVRESSHRYAFSPKDVRVDGQSTRAPLLRTIQGNHALITAFCDRVTAMKRPAFLHEYLVELALLPAHWKHAIGVTEKSYQLYRRFARQYLEFASAYE